MQSQIERTMKNLKKNQMHAVYIPAKTALPALLSNYCTDHKTVTFGGSMTLFETGTIDYLRRRAKENQIHLLDRYAEGLPREQIEEIYRMAFSADIYFTSSNAITEDGYLYNVDGNGNRVAAMIYGPKKVIVIAGRNKIVPDKQAAIKRIQEISTPKNTQRLKLQTPCAKTGACTHCTSPDRICCSYVFLGQQRIKNRIEVILIGEPYGY